MDQVDDAALRVRPHEIRRRVAGQAFHRIADEHRGEVVLHAAAIRDTRDVADQRTQLPLTVAQGLFHGAALADIGHEGDVKFLRCPLLPNREPDRQRRAVRPHRQRLAGAQTDCASDERVQIVADDLDARARKDLLGRSIAIGDHARGIEYDHPIGGRREQRTLPRVAIPQLPD